MQKLPISFRNLAPDIPNTTYSIFGLYKYPAKFIPHIPIYILREYAKPGMKVFDPFAGHGTVGLACRLFGCDYELWDLNPLLNTIHNTAISKIRDLNIDTLVDGMKNCNEYYIPKWDNINYWFPSEFLHELSRIWGFVYNLDEETKSVLLLPLLAITKYFSYDDASIHKLYKSKHAKARINNLLNSDWRSILYNLIKREIHKTLKRLKEYDKLNPQDVEYKIRCPVNVLQTTLESSADILITSPPYLQAQEYIRSTKLALYWLGCDDNYIKSLKQMEIPYCNIPTTQIYSELYHRYAGMITNRRLARLYRNYFNAIIGCLTQLSEKIRRYMLIFVGSSNIRSINIPIDEIITEHFINIGWKHEVTLVDQIKSRSMFIAELNPASKLPDHRIKEEYLIILSR